MNTDNNNINGQIFKDFNVVYLQQVLQQELQEMQSYNQVRYAAISKIVEKVLKHGTASEAIELLQTLPSSQDSAAKLKQWKGIISKVQGIDKQISNSSDKPTDTE